MPSNTTLTTRLVFTSDDNSYYKEEPIEFTWHMGMSWQVRQRSSKSLRDEFLARHPECKVIEISTASEDHELGKKLSALNLTLRARLPDETAKDIPVENIFQGSKVYDGENRPHVELFQQSAKEAKSFSKEMQSHKRSVIRFQYGDKKFELFPYSAFYDWIYIQALHSHRELARQILDYDAFTDIHFNQKVAYSDEGPFNCQARALAIYVSLCHKNKLHDYLQNPEGIQQDIYNELYEGHRQDEQDQLGPSERGQLTLF